ncbi:hypothetical protein SARC_05755 [Sphaeroforma arctica JP610]|uniref:C2H2-type domain-containing protein n=1 Tax=Sphaeroforma arctica JP610 TaxID=667725 RepID=A0A0L0FZF3_9EUKA|nr:hypothetical protein SARC_05755 [Sphaeroforma arctica JP610]KNC81941.1 hypothetical protein SARC_05755 [Sphaeroforma arctica JP610]|eukprot:XP_014155843.1 hypothetical protein SARC_05755 [Sphaeroforma arctica JP610]
MQPLPSAALQNRHWTESHRWTCTFIIANRGQNSSSHLSSGVPKYSGDTQAKTVFLVSTHRQYSIGYISQPAIGRSQYSETQQAKGTEQYTLKQQPSDAKQYSGAQQYFGGYQPLAPTSANSKGREKDHSSPIAKSAGVTDTAFGKRSLSDSQGYAGTRRASDSQPYNGKQQPFVGSKSWTPTPVNTNIMSNSSPTTKPSGVSTGTPKSSIEQYTSKQPTSGAFAVSTASAGPSTTTSRRSSPGISPTASSGDMRSSSRPGTTAQCSTNIICSSSDTSLGYSSAPHNTMVSVNRRNSTGASSGRDIKQDTAGTTGALPQTGKWVSKMEQGLSRDSKPCLFGYTGASGPGKIRKMVSRTESDIDSGIENSDITQFINRRQREGAGYKKGIDRGKSTKHEKGTNQASTAEQKKKFRDISSIQWKSAVTKLADVVVNRVPKQAQITENENKEGVTSTVRCETKGGGTGMLKQQPQTVEYESLRNSTNVQVGGSLPGTASTAAARAYAHKRSSPSASTHAQRGTDTPVQSGTDLYARPKSPVELGEEKQNTVTAVETPLTILSHTVHQIERTATTTTHDQTPATTTAKHPTSVPPTVCPTEQTTATITHGHSSVPTTEKQHTSVPPTICPTEQTTATTTHGHTSTTTTEKDSTSVPPTVCPTEQTTTTITHGHSSVPTTEKDSTSVPASMGRLEHTETDASRKHAPEITIVEPRSTVSANVRPPVQTAVNPKRDPATGAAIVTDPARVPPTVGQLVEDYTSKTTVEKLQTSISVTVGQVERIAAITAQPPALSDKVVSASTPVLTADVALAREGKNVADTEELMPTDANGGDVCDKKSEVVDVHAGVGTNEGYLRDSKSVGDTDGLTRTEAIAGDMRDSKSEMYTEAHTHASAKDGDVRDSQSVVDTIGQPRIAANADEFRDSTSIVQTGSDTTEPILTQLKASVCVPGGTAALLGPPVVNPKTLYPGDMVAGHTSTLVGPGAQPKIINPGNMVAGHANTLVSPVAQLKTQNPGDKTSGHTSTIEGTVVQPKAPSPGDMVASHTNTVVGPVVQPKTIRPGDMVAGNTNTVVGPVVQPKTKSPRGMVAGHTNTVAGPVVQPKTLSSGDRTSSRTNTLAGPVVQSKTLNPGCKTSGHTTTVVEPETLNPGDHTVGHVNPIAGCAVQPPASSTASVTVGTTSKVKSADTARATDTAKRVLAGQAKVLGVTSPHAHGADGSDKRVGSEVGGDCPDRNVDIKTGRKDYKKRLISQVNGVSLNKHIFSKFDGIDSDRRVESQTAGSEARTVGMMQATGGEAQPIAHTAASVSVTRHGGTTPMDPEEGGMQDTVSVGTTEVGDGDIGKFTQTTKNVTQRAPATIDTCGGAAVYRFSHTVDVDRNPNDVKREPQTSRGVSPSLPPSHSANTKGTLEPYASAEVKQEPAKLLTSMLSTKKVISPVPSITIGPISPGVRLSKAGVVARTSGDTLAPVVSFGTTTGAVAKTSGDKLTPGMSPATKAGIVAKTSGQTLAPELSNEIQTTKSDGKTVGGIVDETQRNIRPQSMVSKPVRGPGKSLYTETSDKHTIPIHTVVRGTSKAHHVENKDKDTIPTHTGKKGTEMAENRPHLIDLSNESDTEVVLKRSVGSKVKAQLSTKTMESSTANPVAGTKRKDTIINRVNNTPGNGETAASTTLSVGVGVGAGDRNSTVSGAHGLMCPHDGCRSACRTSEYLRKHIQLCHPTRGDGVPTQGSTPASDGMKVPSLQDMDFDLDLNTSSRQDTDTDTDVNADTHTHTHRVKHERMNVALVDGQANAGDGLVSSATPPVVCTQAAPDQKDMPQLETVSSGFTQTKKTTTMPSLVQKELGSAVPVSVGMRNGAEAQGKSGPKERKRRDKPVPNTRKPGYDPILPASAPPGIVTISRSGMNISRPLETVPHSSANIPSSSLPSNVRAHVDVIVAKPKGTASVHESAVAHPTVGSRKSSAHEKRSKGAAKQSKRKRTYFSDSSGDDETVAKEIAKDRKRKHIVHRESSGMSQNRGQRKYILSSDGSSGSDFDSQSPDLVHNAHKQAKRRKWMSNVTHWSQSGGHDIDSGNEIGTSEVGSDGYCKRCHIYTLQLGETCTCEKVHAVSKHAERRRSTRPTRKVMVVGSESGSESGSENGREREDGGSSGSGEDDDVSYEMPDETQHLTTQHPKTLNSGSGGVQASRGTTQGGGLKENKGGDVQHHRETKTTQHTLDDKSTPRTEPSKGPKRWRWSEWSESKDGSGSKPRANAKVKGKALTESVADGTSTKQKEVRGSGKAAAIAQSSSPASLGQCADAGTGVGKRVISHGDLGASMGTKVIFHYEGGTREGKKVMSHGDIGTGMRKRVISHGDLGTSVGKKVISHFEAGTSMGKKVISHGDIDTSMAKKVISHFEVGTTLGKKVISPAKVPGGLAQRARMGQSPSGGKKDSGSRKRLKQTDVKRLEDREGSNGEHSGVTSSETIPAARGNHGNMSEAAGESASAKESGDKQKGARDDSFNKGKKALAKEASRSKLPGDNSKPSGADNVNTSSITTSTWETHGTGDQTAMPAAVPLTPPHVSHPPLHTLSQSNSPPHTLHPPHATAPAAQEAPDAQDDLLMCPMSGCDEQMALRHIKRHQVLVHMGGLMCVEGCGAFFFGEHELAAHRTWHLDREKERRKYETLNRLKQISSAAGPDSRVVPVERYTRTSVTAQIPGHAGDAATGQSTADVQGHSQAHGSPSIRNIHTTHTGDGSNTRTVVEQNTHRDHSTNTHTAGHKSTYQDAPVPVRQTAVKRDRLRIMCAWSEYCKRVFVSEAKYNRHLKRAHRCRHPTCDRKKQYTNKGKFKEHNERKHKKHTYACELCEGMYDTTTELQAHCVVAHDGVVPCAVGACSEYFDGQNSMRAHFRHHFGDGEEYQCDWKGCVVSFADEVDYLWHKKWPHRCPWRKCERTFIERYDFETHLEMDHANEKTERCLALGCGAMFSSGRDVKKHVDKKHPTCAIDVEAELKRRMESKAKGISHIAVPSWPLSWYSQV